MVSVEQDLEHLDELRDYRSQAHEVFDQLWQKKIMTRTQAYIWLWSKLGTMKEDGHFKFFSKKQCLKAIELVNEYLGAHGKLDKV